MDIKLFKCKKCGKVIELLPGTHGCPTKCCGDPMEELKENTVDAAKEKHVPVVIKKENKIHVQVGSVEHPMLNEHHIAFIYLITDKNIYRNNLKVDSKPTCDFTISEDETPIKVLEYCNLHGLWSKEL